MSIDKWDEQVATKRDCSHEEASAAPHRGRMHHRLVSRTTSSNVYDALRSLALSQLGKFRSLLPTN
jgi:hypothetical protein